MADADSNPVFQIQRVYLKDLSLEQPNSPQILLEQQQPQVDINLALMSLEQPNSPQILLEQQQPQVDINLALSAEGVSDGVFEVCVTATVTTKVTDRTLFLVEAKQAGIFEIRNLPGDQLQGVVSVVCPQILYPYLRAIVSDVCTRAGFPPILLTEVNFQAMYEAQQQQQAAQGGAGNGSSGLIVTAS